ncbi:type II secretion system F family protein [Kitasatospora sp. NPDC094015]|uniref:type II secretion system F family protein n=1 Tax=Kitasatospora sp. NPDC094015 TaxID=3155205 RepID=UPI003316DA9E
MIRLGPVPPMAGLAGLATGFWCGLALLRRRARSARRTRALFGSSWTVGGGVRGLGLRLGRQIRVLRPYWLVPELILLPLGLLLCLVTRSPIPALGALAAVRPLRRWRKRRRTAARARQRAAAVIDLCAGIAVELRSGATAEQALCAVVERSGPRLSHTLGAEPAARLRAAPYGADVPAALRLAAELPGGRGAAAVAACWQITTESGSGLASGLDQVADALRAERALSEEIAGELAGPRATVALLAMLPAVGLLLGYALGAHPVRILLHTPAGLICLLGGVLLETAGLRWTSRIVRAAEGGGGARTGEPAAAGRPVSTAPATTATAPEPATCGLSRVRPAWTEVGG